MRGSLAREPASFRASPTMSYTAEDLTADVGHRPWPLPERPWVMTQRWSDLLFAHWPVAPSVMRGLVPESMPIDLYDGQAWLTIAPFRISALRSRGSPALPWLSSFLELNVRTYVTRDGKPGVWVFSLDAASSLAVLGPRTFYHLPYFHASMRSRSSGNGSVEYRSRREHRGATAAAELVARYGSTGRAYQSTKGTLEHWLTERYCLYAMDSRGRAYRANIHHRPWPLEPAFAELTLETVTKAAGVPVSGEPTCGSFTRSIDVAVWWPERLP